MIFEQCPRVCLNVSHVKTLNANNFTSITRPFYGSSLTGQNKPTTQKPRLNSCCIFILDAIATNKYEILQVYRPLATRSAASYGTSNNALAFLRTLRVVVFRIMQNGVWHSPRSACLSFSQMEQSSCTIKIFHNTNTRFILHAVPTGTILNQQSTPLPDDLFVSYQNFLFRWSR